MKTMRIRRKYRNILCSRLESFRDGHVELLVFDGDDHIPMLVIAEYAGADPAKPVEGLGGRVPVRVVSPNLYNGDLRREPVEE